MLAYNITKDAISLVIGESDYLVPRTSPQAAKVLDELRKKPVDEAEVARLVALEYSPEAYSDGTISIMKNGEVTYKGERLPKALADKVAACYADGVPFNNVLAFFDRLNANPSRRAITELYTFLEHKSMPITPEGHFLAYKGIQLSGYSVMGNTTTVVEKGTVDEGGHILNTVGQAPRVRRSCVNDDFRVGCAEGLHAGSLNYASGWGSKVVIVKIDPADVVSIPSDCSCQKLRTCAYEVVADYKGKLSDSGVNNAARPYDMEDADDWDDEIDDEVEVRCTGIGCAAREAVRQALWQQAYDTASVNGEEDREDGNDPSDASDLEANFEALVMEIFDVDVDGVDVGDYPTEFAQFKESYYSAYRGE